MGVNKNWMNNFRARRFNSKPINNATSMYNPKKCDVSDEELDICVGPDANNRELIKSYENFNSKYKS